MSYFDPHKLYYRSNRKTHKGQILQKRFVDHDSSFTKEDLDRSFRVLTAYGYYFSRYPPNTPILKTLSLSKKVSFSSDDILDLNELITSSLRTNILDIDSNFFQLDPAEVKHCYFYVGILLVECALTTGTTYTVALHDGTQTSFTWQAATGKSYLTYYSPSKLGLSVGNTFTTADRETLEDSAAVTFFAVDDIDIYRMLYDNDFSSLLSYPLIQISQNSDYNLSASIQYSISIVNFD